MCNEFARNRPLDKFFEELSRIGHMPSPMWDANRIPNDLDGKNSVKIRDATPIFRLKDNRLSGSMTTWAWLNSQKKPVFNFVSEDRDFSKNDRVLVFADAFYEFTTPQKSKTKLKDKHQFKLKNEDWFWIAGIVKDGCFTLLTTTPGPDLIPYHDRQIVIMKPSDGLAWLNLSLPQNELLRSLPHGSFDVRTVRKDGIEQGD